MLVTFHIPPRHLKLSQIFKEVVCSISRSAIRGVLYSSSFAECFSFRFYGHVTGWHWPEIENHFLKLKLECMMELWKFGFPPRTTASNQNKGNCFFPLYIRCGPLEWVGYRDKSPPQSFRYNFLLKWETYYQIIWWTEKQISSAPEAISV